MTAQSSAAESEPAGRCQPPSATGALTPPSAAGEQGAHALDLLLRSQWPVPSGPTRFGENGSKERAKETTQESGSGENNSGESGFGQLQFRADGFAALRFDATPGSVTRTRSFLRSTLTRWRLPDLVDDATSIAAELVANAVTHALQPPAPPALVAPTAWIALLRTEHAVVCAVADPSPVPPAMSDPGPFAESGRGLRIVAELSQTWGHSPPEPAGKTVWAQLASDR
jgi:hypothetical protein